MYMATLEEVKLGRKMINENHFYAFKKLLLTNLRAEWKKERIKHMSFIGFMKNVDLHWTFQRVVFYPNGRCEYITGQDHRSEMLQLQDAVIGKKYA